MGGKCLGGISPTVGNIPVGMAGGNCPGGSRLGGRAHVPRNLVLYTM